VSIREYACKAVQAKSQCAEKSVRLNVFMIDDISQYGIVSDYK